MGIDVLYWFNVALTIIATGCSCFAALAAAQRRNHLRIADPESRDAVDMQYREQKAIIRAAIWICAAGSGWLGWTLYG